MHAPQRLMRSHVAFWTLRNLHSFSMKPKMKKKKSAAAQKSSPKSEEVKVISSPNEGWDVTMTELVLPSHTNALGTIFGGVIMGWIDIAGAIAAQRYSRSAVVTVSIDYLHFIVPVKTGYTVSVLARVSYAGTTSIETEVWVDAENVITGEKRRATEAYLTYVAIDDFGKPRRVPPFTVKGPDAERRVQEAIRRRENRLAMRNIVSSRG